MDVSERMNQITPIKSVIVGKTWCLKSLVFQFLIFDLNFYNCETLLLALMSLLCTTSTKGIKGIYFTHWKKIFGFDLDKKDAKN